VDRDFASGEGARAAESDGLETVVPTRAPWVQIPPPSAAGVSAQLVEVGHGMVELHGDELLVQGLHEPVVLATIRFTGA
jgi:hypothetical protein